MRPLTGRRLFSTSKPVLKSSLVNGPFAYNTSQLPKFTPKSNKSPALDLAKHQREKWPVQELEDAIAKNSVFTWGATDALRPTCPTIERGEGIYLYDHSGKRYVDWSAGAVCSNLGHTMPEPIKRSISEQMNNLPFCYADLTVHEPRARLSALLADIFPSPLKHSIFFSGGAEANECAIRMARRVTGRLKILSRSRSYHGGTTGALATTGDFRTWMSDGTHIGHVKMMDPYPFHFSWDPSVKPDGSSSLGRDSTAWVPRYLNYLHDLILAENPKSIAAIFLESITGANGWMHTPTELMQGVRALCDHYGILLVCDEVMCGFGRTGTLFGFQHFDGVMPDMVTFAKGITGAFLPLSGVQVSSDIFEFFKKNPLGFGTTYSSHPLPCAAGYATVKYILETGLVEHVQKMEGVMLEELSKLVETHPSVKQARGTGLGAGFDLANKDGNFLSGMHEASPGTLLFRQRLREHGVLTLVRGHHVHCTPPLIITEDQIRETFAVIDKCLFDLDEWILSN